MRDVSATFFELCYKMTELLQLRSSLVSLSDAVTQQRMDTQRAHRFLVRSRELIRVMNDMKTSMRCQDSSSEAVCTSLRDTDDTQRCSWNHGGCSSNTLPVGDVPEVSAKRVEKAVTKLKVELATTLLTAAQRVNS